MFCENKNYNEIALRQLSQTYYPAWLIRYKKFKESVSKICPKCGAILLIDDKGCNNCLFQFDDEEKK